MNVSTLKSWCSAHNSLSLTDESIPQPPATVPGRTPRRVTVVALRAVLCRRPSRVAADVADQLLRGSKVEVFSGSLREGTRFPLKVLVPRQNTARRKPWSFLSLFVKSIWCQSVIVLDQGLQRCNRYTDLYYYFDLFYTHWIVRGSILSTSLRIFTEQINKVMIAV